MKIWLHYVYFYYSKQKREDLHWVHNLYNVILTSDSFWGNIMILADVLASSGCHNKIA